MKIRGHSCFDVKLEKLEDKIVISKSSSPEDFSRLSRQIEKQESFFSKYSKRFGAKTPKIIKNQNNKFYMEYIYFSENFIDFSQKGNVRKTNWFLKNIFNIVEKYFSECNYSYIGKGILEEKINSVEKNISKNSHIEANCPFVQESLKYLHENTERIESTAIPLGVCHGDFTFSNILIDHSNMDLYLIDFLDSFIESPMLDIVKIRQDTKFYWISQMYTDDFDKNSIFLTLKYMDTEVERYFSKYEFYRETYDFFERLNILRVLQYSKNGNMKLFSDTK
jgi:serine/threonine protein kinase